MNESISKNVMPAVAGSADETHTGSEPLVQMTRRAFIRKMTMSAAAFAVAGCGGGGGGSAVSVDQAAASNQAIGSNQGIGSNHAPIWDTIPTITFTQGTAATFSIAAYVSDEDHDALTITKNSVSLPAGVTYDPATKSFIYDGIGGVAVTDGHVLTATEA